MTFKEKDYKGKLECIEKHYSNDALYEALRGYVEEKGCKNGFAMWPVRTAVSGKQNTPVIFHILQWHQPSVSLRYCF